MSELEEGKKYCKYCGEVIDEDCVVCPKCGKQVELLKDNSTPVIVNNSASSSATLIQPKKKKKKYNHLLDLILICCTSGLWIIWMIIRPKYEYQEKNRFRNESVFLCKKCITEMCTK